MNPTCGKCLLSLRTWWTCPLPSSANNHAEWSPVWIEILGPLSKANARWFVHHLVKAAARLFPGKNTRLLFHDQIILYGFDPFDATCDFTRLIDGHLRTNEAAQLNGALVGFNTDLE